MKRTAQIAIYFALFIMGALAVEFPVETLLSAIILGISLLAAYGLLLLNDERR